MNKESAEAIAEKVLEYLSSQTYQGEPLLHAIVCCDFVSRKRLEQALAKIVGEG